MGKGSVNSEGYRMVSRPGHPIASKLGRVLEHRAVLFDAIGPGPHPCHWCGWSVNWKSDAGGRINVDHLDDNRLNNALDNLVPSCMDCNTRRSKAASRHGKVAMDLLKAIDAESARTVLLLLSEAIDSRGKVRHAYAGFELKHIAELVDYLSVDPHGVNLPAYPNWPHYVTAKQSKEDNR